jgi:protein-disulfide isomerase
MTNKPGIICIVQRGCPACHEFVPRLRKAVRGTGVAVEVLDVARGQRAMKIAEHYNVRGTPTTLISTTRGTLIRRVGGIDDAELGRLIRRASGA